MSFIIDNLATIIVAVVVFGIILGIAGRLLYNRKQGKSGCGSDCCSCPNAGACHPK